MKWQQVRSQAMKDIDEDETLPLTNPDEHHYFSKTQYTPINLLQLCKDNENDPTTKVCQILSILV